MSFVDICEKIDCVVTAPHCIRFMIYQPSWGLIFYHIHCLLRKGRVKYIRKTCVYLDYMIAWVPFRWTAHAFIPACLIHDIQRPLDGNGMTTAHYWPARFTEGQSTAGITQRKFLCQNILGQKIGSSRLYVHKHDNRNQNKKILLWHHTHITHMIYVNSRKMWTIYLVIFIHE